MGNKMKKKITIITTFRSADEAYSLNRIVIDQIKMFTKAGYKLDIIVAKGFEPKGWYAHKDVTCQYIPDVPVHNDLKIDETFEKDVESLMVEFEKLLKDTDVAITHDVTYQPAAMKHNAALRTLANMGKVKATFLHWIHSATCPSVLQDLRGGGEKYLDSFSKPFPNSFYIAFNEYSIPRIAKWFKIEEDKVKYIPHPHDFFEDKDDLVEKISDRGQILQKDVVCMYPCRLDRGKQPHLVLETIAQIKKLKRSVCLIIADFHSTAGDKVTYRDEMKTRAIDLGLAEDELIFLSEFDVPEDQDFRYEIPHKVINQLFELTNVFILPSRSETYSLVAQEAVAKRNFIVLNQDFPPFRSIYGDAAYYRQYSSDMDAMNGLDGNTNTEYSDAETYHNATAKYINYVMENTRVLKLFNKIRQTRNLDYVFSKHIEPLMYADPKEFNY